MATVFCFSGYFFDLKLIFTFRIHETWTKHRVQKGISFFGATIFYVHMAFQINCFPKQKKLVPSWYPKEQFLQWMFGDFQPFPK